MLCSDWTLRRLGRAVQWESRHETDIDNNGAGFGFDGTPYIVVGILRMECSSGSGRKGDKNVNLPVCNIVFVYVI